MTHREIGEYVQAQNGRQEEDFKKQAILLDGLYRQWISTQQKKPRVLNLKELYPSLFGKKAPQAYDAGRTARRRKSKHGQNF